MLAWVSYLLHLGLLENVLPESDAYNPKDVLHPLRCAGIISGVETTNN